MTACKQCGGYHDDLGDGGECICGLCKDGQDCPVHETGRFARQAIDVIDMRPVSSFYAGFDRWLTVFGEASLKEGAN